jgi:signal transduction histidine kinase
MKQTLFNYIIISITALLLVVGNIWISNFITNNKTQELEAVHRNAMDEFTETVEGFGLFVSSIQTYINEQKVFPDQQHVFNYVRNIARGTELENKYVISLLDTTHTFIYSFDYNRINSNNLIGQNLEDIVDPESMAKYSQLMKEDAFKLFKLHNLVEGQVGISLNFRTKNKEQTIGYGTPVVYFKAAIEEVYKQVNTEKFVFHFSTGDSIDFDRDRVHDNSKVYHDRYDSLYYKKFQITSEGFKYGNISIYGYNFIIGTARKKIDEYNWILIASVLWFIIFSSLLLYNNNQSVKLKKSSFLIGEQKEQLVKLNKEKDGILGVVAHDLRSPINHIQGLTELLELTDLKKDDPKPYFDRINKSIGQMHHLINDLLKISNFQNADNVSLNVEEVNIDEFLTELFEVTSKNAEPKQQKLVMDSIEGLLLSTDRLLLWRVLENLISNAIKFSPEGKKISVVVKQINNEMEFMIKDEGPGFSEEDKMKMFIKFQKLSAMPTGGEISTGLGLSIVKMIVDKLSGSVKVESNLGEGSSFYVTIPNI